ncbi:dTMP kinase [Dellaglioa carnosa]|uniref:Thymidylate kinase n=1 Tax=Dellaglioa carnosa TaxID=2995136 RepID=A0ABT4JP26_9LACO|nr:dTMP kinase [Dellaglioa carnosa]MCZ2491751.1 dTMP kinase [Dellaglioa carnosa]MCZ2494849.1 dTMP kinase [Dellaglioa carnosa]MDK1731712.1 dTMP kinase [Dellaglioa carnosa]
MTGKFVTIEGPDGSGKTSALKGIIEKIKVLLATELVVTREPGGNPISEAVRDVVLNQDYPEMDKRTEALLFAASRRQHIVETILPALEANKLVMCDRYVDSSIAYQGAGRDIGMQAVADMNLFATNGTEPDLTLYFDVPSEIGLKRIFEHRQNEVNRLDDEKLAFHQKVRKAYQQLAVENPERIVTIDATQPLDKVIEDCTKVLMKKLPESFK